MKKVYLYAGFEDSFDMGRDMAECLEDPVFATLEPEWQGTLKVTVEYIPNTGGAEGC